MHPIARETELGMAKNNGRNYGTDQKGLFLFLKVLLRNTLWVYLAVVRRESKGTSSNQEARSNLDILRRTVHGIDTYVYLWNVIYSMILWFPSV